MNFREVKNQIKECVLKSIETNGLPIIDFEPNEPPNIEYGDLSVNISFELAKKTGLKPFDVAQKIMSKISLPEESLIKKFWVQKPAYINFRINYGKLAELLFRNIDMITTPSYVNVGLGEKVAVEHTSVNPNKALHYGHLRNVVIGDSVAKILEFTGHKVHILNYVDDSGLQVADLVVGFLYANLPLDSNSKKFDEYCGDEVYTKVNNLYSERDDLIEAQKKVLLGLEKHDGKIAKFAKEITERILKEQLKTCWRIGSRYDLINFESHILESNMWRDIFSELQRQGIVEEAVVGKYSGCWIVRIEGEPEGEEKVVLRSDGTATYIAKDIPYAAWKLGVIDDRFHYNKFIHQPTNNLLWRTTLNNGEKNHPIFSPYDKSITVIDVRQARLQRIIRYIIDKISSGKRKGSYIHLGYEVVFLSGKTADELGFESEGRKIVGMSGRKGIYVNADRVIDIMTKKAYVETSKRNPEQKKGWIQEIAEKIAVAAIRFDLLKQDLDKSIIFDLNRALSLDGETGPYLQYTYARAIRIIRKAESKDSTLYLGDTYKLTDSSEITLLKEMSKFDLILEDAARNLSPKLIARYLFKLTSLFNVFYEKKPILKEPDDSIKFARLALVDSFTIILEKGLYLLGIEFPERI